MGRPPCGSSGRGLAPVDLQLPVLGYQLGPFARPNVLIAVLLVFAAGFAVYAINVRFFCAVDGLHVRKWSRHDKVIGWEEISSVDIRAAGFRQGGLGRQGTEPN